jgi:hypothetical protein
MRSTIVIALLAAATARGQADFELQTPPCSYVFPAPCGATGDPEGVARALSTGISYTPATVDTANNAGMPCVGLQYARIVGTGPLPVPIGGPIPASLFLGSRLFIPVPPGSVTVSFCWDFYLVDFPPQTAYNDGMSVDFIAGCTGRLAGNLAYADAFTPSSGGITDSGSPCTGNAWDVLPAWQPQIVFNAPVPAAATHIRVTVWNGGDDFASSHGVIDAVTFSGGTPPCILSFTSPAGAGSVMMDNTPCAASIGLSYFTAIDLTPGAWPAGWFFGLDIGVPELLSLFAFGPPFTGAFDAAGASTTGLVGPHPGISGISLFAVTTEWTASYATLVQVRPSVAYVIP